MDKQLLPAIAGVTTAIAITTTMDATGYSVFSALPLMPLALLFWYLQKFTRAEIGLTPGAARAYLPALLHPVLVLSVIAAIAALAGATDTSGADWSKTLANIGITSTVGVIMVMITEEGFFRGWLWAALQRAGVSDGRVLLWTTLAFVAWHLSAILLDTGFDVPPDQVPVYLVNATILGAVWGALRYFSGSVVVAAASHALWNAIDYPLFGFGERVGALGIEATRVFGPEVGVVGIAVNLSVSGFLFYRFSWIRK